MERRIRLMVIAAILCGVAALAWGLHAQAPGPAPQGQGGAPGANPAAAQASGTESGYGVFQQHCTSCHGNPNVTPKAPDPDVLRQLSPETILDALTNGVMQIQGQSLTDDQKRRVAESVSGRLLGTAASGDASKMPNVCATNPPLKDPSSGPAWNGWGVDSANTRSQTAKGAQLSADQVPKLKLKWAFGYPGGVSASGEPSVAGGRVYVGTDTGFVYSLDASSGCVYWSFQTKAGIRAAPSVGPISGHDPAKYAVFVGDLKANMYALNAQNGQLLWTHHMDDHFTSRVTGAPTLYEGRLFVPISSWEEFSARTPDYPCCTSRGSVTALNANTGEQIWKTYTVADTPKPVRKNSLGVQLWAPAGVSVWNAPTVDAKRNAIYFGTGDAETEPAVDTSDAVMALDMKTGQMLWAYQAQKNDSFLAGCNGANKPENCPQDQGPDYDIGNSPMLRTLKDGKRVVIAGTKDGDVFALDPDNKGALLWRTKVTHDQRSGIVWGGTADEERAYFGLSGGGLVAVDLASGETLWTVPLRPDNTRVWQAGATSSIPGVIFVPGGDGILHAVSAKDGKELWQYNSAHDFTTVNKVTAKGGSIRAPGMIVAGGMLFTGSGYGFGGTDITGNVLLAFSIQ